MQSTGALDTRTRFTWTAGQPVWQRLIATAIAAAILLGMSLTAPATANAAQPLPHLGETFTTDTGQQWRFDPMMPMCGDVGMGTQGECVAVLQRALNSIANAGLRVDGQAGPSTITALQAYQQQRGIPDLRYANNTTRFALMVDYYRAYPAEAARANFDWGIRTGSLYLTRTQTQALTDAFLQWRLAVQVAVDTGAYAACAVIGGAVTVYTGPGAAVVAHAAGAGCSILINALFNQFSSVMEAANTGYGCLRIRFNHTGLVERVYNDGGRYCRL
ncbi:peptidoglycan-binding protein [Geodermatophilus sabuli]|uniref:Peptidoglycan-binding protein n=1 Tax=Geodermatophilus sabuli TaxID=1564158 RepID=A0A7K3W7P6_9ACTN|nr:peptidoglycan-binding domain-containing protein [Geodermatophilus sabuli]NEK60224.1 peptidoglycan-binding protein [Geodermatophilus sabuli]